MSVSELLEAAEKKAVRKQLLTSEPIVTGVCQFLLAKFGRWESSFGGGVAVVSINDKDEQDVKFMELLEDDDVIHAQTVFRTVLNANVTVTKPHEKLIVMELKKEAMTIGLNFFMKVECDMLYDKVQQEINNKTTPQEVSKVVFRKEPAEAVQPENKKKKKGFRKSVASFFFAKDRKSVEIGSPTDFRHVAHGGLNSDQQELLDTLVKEINVKDEKEMEIIKKVVVAREKDVRKSLIAKNEKKPKKTKEKKVMETVAEVPSEPVDPLKADWGDASPVPQITKVPPPPPPSRFQSLSRQAVTNRQSYRWAVSESPIGTVRTITDHAEFSIRPEMPDHSPPPLPMEFEAPPPPFRVRHTAPQQITPKEENSRQNAQFEESSRQNAQFEESSRQFAQIEEIPPPEAKNVPPPPPPPPPMDFSLNNNKSPVDAARKDFLSEIQNADPTKLLKKAVPRSPPPARADGRDSLLAEIQQLDRTKLRKASDRPKEDLPSPMEGNILEQIQKCLDARRLGISPSDDEEEESSSEEWED